VARCPASTSRPPRADGGVASVVTALMVVPLVMVLAVVVDGARVLVAQQRVQDAAEAAVTLSASTWQAGSNPSARCATSTMASQVTANAGPSADVACTWRSSSTGGRFEVVVTQRVELLFARLLRRPTPEVTATSAAEVGTARTASGLRPLGLCLNHPAIPPAPTSGGGSGGGKKSTSTTVATGTYGTKVRIEVDADDGRCGTASGNWGVLDLNGGSSSNSETQEWIEQGYTGTVAGTTSGSPGIPSGSLNLDAVVDPSNSDPARVITVPLYSTVSGGGSNAQFEIVSFIALTVTGFKLTGSGRYIEVVFKTTGRTAYGTTGIDATLYRGVNAWRICALDETRVC
jgi:Flp pilus assembly protein TadG